MNSTFKNSFYLLCFLRVLRMYFVRLFTLRCGRQEERGVSLLGGKDFSKILSGRRSNKKLAAGAKGVGRKMKESDISYALGFEDSLQSHPMFSWVVQKMWGLKRMDTLGWSYLVLEGFSYRMEEKGWDYRPRKNYLKEKAPALFSSRNEEGSIQL